MLQEAPQLLRGYACIPRCQLRHSYHGICERTQIIFIHYTWRHVSVTLKRTLKELFAKQTMACHLMSCNFSTDSPALS